MRLNPILNAQHSSLTASTWTTSSLQIVLAVYYLLCIYLCFTSFIHSFIHSFISIQPLGRFGRNQSSVRWPLWLWHAASWANFLGVGCHYFPPLLDVPTFAARCLHVRNDARDPNSQRWNCGRECCPVIWPKWRLPRHLGICYMPQIYDMGPTALLPLRRKACWRFFFRPFFSPLKIRRIWTRESGVLNASTLPLYHRSRLLVMYVAKNIYPTENKNPGGGIV